MIESPDPADQIETWMRCPRCIKRPISARIECSHSEAEPLIKLILACHACEYMDKIDLYEDTQEEVSSIPSAE